MGQTRSDGLTISYDDLGQGEPALLCLSGWSASRRAYADFVPLAARKRRALALDWRGHGDSDTPPGDFGMEELVRDALAVIEASGAQRIVPLTTAHAGWVAIELRRRLGFARVPKLVLIDWIVTAPPPPFLGVLAAMQDPARWLAAREQLFAMWLHGVTHHSVIRFVREDMSRVGFDMWARGAREIGAAYARAGSPLEALAQLDPPTPTLHLYTQSPNPDFVTAQQAFSAAHPWFEVLRFDVPSHFPTLEAPDQLIAQIESFLMGV
jgi:pimeloyl-ACP methyl ester carboxylesterase